MPAPSRRPLVHLALALAAPVVLAGVAGLVGTPQAKAASGGAAPPLGSITVSAAVSLSNALREVAPLFEAAHPGARLQFNFGASGALLAQMAKGAPVDAFVSADQETMDQAQAQGLVKAALRRDVVSNTLVLVVPSSPSTPSQPRPPQQLADLRSTGYARIAMGWPSSVPAGRYAQAALQQAGLWSAVEPKVVGASTVRQALDYVARGEADAGFVYGTDALLMRDRVKVALAVPTPAAIRYPAAPLTSAPNPAGGEQFVRFLLTPAAQAALARHGFGKP